MTREQTQSWRFVLMMAVVSTAVPVLAQDEMPEMTPEMQAEMAVWRELAQPGEHHEHLAPFVGTWKGAVQMWMQPAGEPMINESLSTASWLLDGRFLTWEHTGDFGGMPWKGMSIEGYNNGDQRYESTWIDNYGTLMMWFTGSCSDGGKARTMQSEFVDHAAGGGTVQYKVVYTWVDDDHFDFETYLDKGEGEFRNLFIRYERQ